MTEKINQARAKLTRAATDIHPKVKVPAIIGTIATLALGIAAAVGAGVPAVIPITSAVTTGVTTFMGYVTTGD
jgi:hypothetical protein